MPVDSFLTIIQPAYIRCGLHDKSLQRKQASIQDSIDLIAEVSREIASQKDTLNVVGIAGIVSWTAIIVTDLIQDTVDVVPNPRQKILFFILGKAKESADKHKFDGNPYKGEIEKIDKASKALKDLIPKKQKELQLTVKVFSNLAKNSVGFMGYLKTQEEAQKSVNQSLSAALRQLAKLQKSLEDINALIADDARTDDSGAQPGQNRSERIDVAPKVNFSKP